VLSDRGYGIAEFEKNAIFHEPQSTMLIGLVFFTIAMSDHTIALYRY